MKQNPFRRWMALLVLAGMSVALSSCSAIADWMMSLGPVETAARAKEVAQNYCGRRGWPSNDMVVQNLKDHWFITTNAERSRGNAYFVIQKKTGRILQAIYRSD